MDEIPSDELDEALIRFVAELHSVTEDELTARIASVFGWERRGPDIAEALGRAIRSLVSRRRIKRDGALLAVNA